MYRFALVLLLACGAAFAEQPEVIDRQTEVPAWCEKIIALGQGSVERRGCCSYHGGVCGCSGGRQQCYDGALSPTCTCNHEVRDEHTN